MATYYNYIDQTYGDTFNAILEILFEDEFEKALDKFKNAINSTSEIGIQEKFNINNRNVWMVYSKNGFSVDISDKQ